MNYKVIPSLDKLRALVQRLLRDGEFRNRGLSHLAVTDDFFFKIPRSMPTAVESSLSPLSNAESLLEHKFTDLLQNFSSHVVPVIAQIPEYSCIVRPRIAGADASRLIMVDRTPNRIISLCIEVLAEIHRNSLDSDISLPCHNYRQDPFCPLDYNNVTLESKIKNKKVLISHGFEIRNLFVSKDNRVLFFDPHTVVYGAPEEDYTRFLLSLLMLNWGRNLKCWIWRQFSERELREHYQKCSGLILEQDVLNYCMQLNVNMRKHFAKKEINKMSAVVRVLARVYSASFFRQIELWRKLNGFT